MKNKGYVKFWGQIRCIKGDLQVAYGIECWKKSYTAIRWGKKSILKGLGKKILTQTKSPQNSNGRPLT